MDEVDRAVPDSPLNQSRLFNAYGLNYLTLGEPAAAARSLSRALELIRNAETSEPQLVAEYSANLAKALRRAGRQDEAVKYFEEALANYRKALGPHAPESIAMEGNLAWMRFRAASSAEDIARDVDQATKSWTDVLEAAERHLGSNHSVTATIALRLGRELVRRQHPRDAIKYLQAALSGRESSLEKDSVETLIAANDLAAALMRSKEIKKSISIFEDNLERQRKILTTEHKWCQTTMGNLATAYRIDKNYEKESQLLGEILRIHYTESVGKIAGVSPTLGECLIRLKEYSNAERVLNRSLCLLDERFIANDKRWVPPYVKSLLGEALIGQGLFEEAKPVLLDAVGGMESAYDQLPASKKRRLLDAYELLAQIFRDLGQAEEADQWLQKSKKTTSALSN